MIFPIDSPLDILDKFREFDRRNWFSYEEKYYSPLRKRGGTRKIRDINPPCNHPEHSPPNMQVFEPGVYEHVCPACGKIQIFRVNGAWL